MTDPPPSVSVASLEVAIRIRIHPAELCRSDFVGGFLTPAGSIVFIVPLCFMMFYPPKFAKDYIIGCQIPYGVPLPFYVHFIYVHSQLSNLDSELKHREIKDPGCLCVRDIRSNAAGIEMWAMHLVW